MNKKLFLTFILVSLFIISLCSYTFAANNGSMDSAKNSVMNVGNSIGNAAVQAKNAVVGGAKDVANGAATIGNDAMNMGKDAVNGATDGVDSATRTLNDGETSDYTATRTSTANDNFLGMSTGAWTWLILGIVGIIIVALVWFYGSQYEHRNYNE